MNDPPSLLSELLSYLEAHHRNSIHNPKILAIISQSKIPTLDQSEISQIVKSFSTSRNLKSSIERSSFKSKLSSDVIDSATDLQTTTDLSDISILIFLTYFSLSLLTTNLTDKILQSYLKFFTYNSHLFSSNMLLFIFDEIIYPSIQTLIKILSPQSLVLLTTFVNISMRQSSNAFALMSQLFLLSVIKMNLI